MNDTHETWNARPNGSQAHIDPWQFQTKSTGMLMDHANDHNCLFDLNKAQKTKCDHEFWGEDTIVALLLSSPLELVSIIAKANEEKIMEARGANAWDALSTDTKTAFDAAMHDNIHLQLGEAAYAALSDDEKECIGLFICAGCCMHKEMNSEKGGAAEIALYWIRAGIPGPVKLMNKDDAAVASLGPSDANKSTKEVSQGGAIRVTSLAVAIFVTKMIKRINKMLFIISLKLDWATWCCFPTPAVHSTPTVKQQQSFVIYGISY